MPIKSPFTKEERKSLRGMLTNKQYRQVYYRTYREVNGDVVREKDRTRLRGYRRLKKEGVCKHHWNTKKSERLLKKEALTCHDLVVISSMDRFALTVNRIIEGKLMLTYNTDETEKQKMVV